MLDDVARRKLAELLMVDDIEVVNSLSDTITIVLTLRGLRMRTTFDASAVSTPRFGLEINDLAKALRRKVDGVDVTQVMDMKVAEVAAAYGMPRFLLGNPDDQLQKAAVDRESRCAGVDCGHTASMHGRGRTLECTIWGCSCPCYISPLAQVEQMAPKPAGPTTRFEAVVEEMKKL